MSTAQQLPLAQRPRHKAEDYTIAWLCADPEYELTVAKRMLDNRHVPAQHSNPRDKNVYEFGDINRHNIILASLGPNLPGLLSAQRLVQPLSESFPNLELYMFVGIGGGIPRNPPSTDPKKDIHLGDVVVGWNCETNAPSIIHYNRSRHQPNNKYYGARQTEMPNDQLIKALGLVCSDLEGGETEYDHHLCRLSSLPTYKRFGHYQHPGIAKDILFEAGYCHNKEINPDDCGKCDEKRIVKRADREDTKMVFHRGLILSGDKVMEDGEERDLLREGFPGAICIEMEAAGVMQVTRCLVIRGISDYADSHKNSDWQRYAAATAAAFAREILFKVHPVSKADNIKRCG